MTNAPNHGAIPKLQLVRPAKDSAAMHRRINVTLDGHRVAGLRRGDAMIVEVAAGQHVVRAELDWVRIERMLTLMAGDMVTIEVSYPLSSVFATFFKPTKAIVIRQL